MARAYAVGATTVPAHARDPDHRVGRARGPRAGRGRAAPAGRRAPRPRPRHARGDQLRRHPRPGEHLPRALRAPVHARAPRSRAWWRRTARGFQAGQRVVALVGTGGYAEYVAAPAATAIPVPTASATGRRSRSCCRASPRGTCSGPPRSSRRARASSSTPPPAGSARSRCSSPGRSGPGRVIATASTEEKRALALELGADAAVDVTREDLGAALREANLGERVDVVLEMAGGRVFDASLDALAPFGRLVTYGMASREPNQVGERRADAHEPRGGGLLAHALPPAAGGDGRRAAARPLRAASRAASCGWSRARRTGSPRRAARTRSCRRGAPPASCCSTRRAEPRGGARSKLAEPNMTTFADLRLSEAVLSALRDVGYESPSPIQEQAIPELLAGQGRDRPGPDRHGQDRRLRPADGRLRRPRRPRHAGARAHADARAVHPGDAGAAHLRQVPRDRPGRRLRRRADPHPAGAAQGRARRSSSAPSAACST